MAWDKEALIENLIKDGYLKTPGIIEAFRRIDRQNFVPVEMKDMAYLNQPLPIGLGQTISQPLTVAFMLELLQPKSGEKILDVGAGSGWQTALLAYLVGENGLVVAIERLPELKKMAEENISKYDIEKGVVKMILGDGAQSYYGEAMFDRIIAAAAAEEIPQAWKKQLKVGGRIVAPVGSSIVVLDKTGPEEFTQKQYFGFSFVPLITG